MGVKTSLFSGGLKNGCMHFKLILSCFFSMFSPLAKFHPNRMKKAEVENFRFWLVLVGQAGRSKNGRSHFKHSIAVWKVINDLCTKFELNRMKNGRISPFLNFWLFGWLGRSAWAKLKIKLHNVMTSHHTKFQLDSTKRSQVIPLQKSITTTTTTTTTTTPTRVEL